MSQAQKAPEPGMEDLLASIRKAITEDSAARTAVSASNRSQSMSDRRQSEILKMSSRMPEQPPERTAMQSASRPSGFAGILSGETGFRSAADSSQPGEPDPSLSTGGRMLSPEAAASAESAFSRLADSLVSRSAGGRSIEDITRDLLRPMLKQWLDEHLPALVERLVREEIERVARRGGR